METFPGVVLKQLEEPYENADDTFSKFMSLTDDQKVVEQSRCSDYYQKIDDDTDTHDYSSVGDNSSHIDAFDGYEYIDEKDDVEYDNDNLCDTSLEWRVLSRLEGETGDDWRIVTDLNSMPRRTKCDSSTEMNGSDIMHQLSKEFYDLGSSCQPSVKNSNNQNKIDDDKETFSVESDSNSEQPVSAKTFLEKLLNDKRDHFNSETAGHWLRKQVTFGE